MASTTLDNSVAQARSPGDALVCSSCAPRVLLCCFSCSGRFAQCYPPAHHRAPVVVRQHEFSHYSNEVVFDFTPSKWGLFTSTGTAAWITDDFCRKTASRFTIA